MNTLFKLRDQFESPSQLSSEKRQSQLLRLGSFHLCGHLGEGGQGSVFEAVNDIGRRFAVKFRSTQELGNGSDQESRDWKDEIQALVKFQHHSIVRIFEAGIASYSEDVGWIISSINDTEPSKDSYAYLIMEYVPCDLSEAFPKTDILHSLAVDYEDRFDRLILDICEALELCHNSRIAHRDVSVKNIRYSPEDDSFILTDFGLASNQKHRAPTQPDLGKNLSAFQEDVLSLVNVLSDVLARLAKPLSGWRGRGLRSQLQRVRNEPWDTKNIPQLRNALAPFLRVTGWTLNLRIGQSLVPSLDPRFRWDSKVRIPQSGSVLLCPAVRAIIDTPVFQRLRLVKQLGPTSYVFPGATHTRFEHSLGVYHLCCLYLQRLSQLEVFRSMVDLDYAVRLTTAAALLHDIGHYPFSHWVEELRKTSDNMGLLSHELRVAEIIDKSELKSILSEIWEIDPSDVCDLIVRGRDSKFPVLGSIISSNIDCDKLDYLVRDSLHCGVDYGQGIDVERFIDSLYVNTSRETICLNKKGRAGLMGITYCRNTMYKEVYWHKTVRCFMAMFKRAFFEYSKTSDFSSRKHQLQESSDEFFLQQVAEVLKLNKSPAASLLDVFRGGARHPLKTIFTFQQNEKSTSAPVRSFCKEILEYVRYEDLINMTNALREALNQYAAFPPIVNGENFLGEFDLLIEVTPAKNDTALKNEPDEGWMFDEKNGNSVNSEAESAVLKNLNEYLPASHQVFIYAADKFSRHLSSQLSDEEFARNVFTKAREIAGKSKTLNG